MCSPAFAVMGLQAAGGIYSAGANLEMGRDQQNYYNFLAAQNENQAQDALQTADKQGSLIQDSASRELGTIRSEGRKVVGKQKVALAANGIDLGSVTAEDLARDRMNTEDLDVAALRYNADTAAWETAIQARQQAASLRDQAASYRLGGSNARKAGYINAGSSILGSATSVASTWYDWSKTSRGSTPNTAPSDFSRGLLSKRRIYSSKLDLY